MPGYRLKNKYYVSYVIDGRVDVGVIDEYQ